MDINQAIAEWNKRRKNEKLQLPNLLQMLQPQSMTYADTPGRGVSNILERKAILRDPGGYDSNELYGDLNDLYKRNPEAHREMQKRMLDRGLKEDLRELAPYRRYRAVTM